MQLHLVIQPKGGAGKSFTALHLIQYLAQNTAVKAFDLDSANNTLSQFKALQAVPVDIRMDDNPRKVDTRKFDTLLENIIEAKTSHVVVDIGASIIDPFLNHCHEINFFSMSDELGIEQVVIHCPISGGQGFVDNLGGLKMVYDFIGASAKYIIWENPFFGDLSHNGVPLEKTKIFTAIQQDILGVVKIPVWDSETKKDDVKRMVTSKLTYEEVANSDAFKVFNKARLKSIKADFFARLDAINFTSDK